MVARSNLYVAVKATLAGVCATGSRATCERVATFLEAQALNLREIALTRAVGPPDEAPADPLAEDRMARVRALLRIDPNTSAELACRIVGGKRAATLVIVQAVREELGLPARSKKA